MNKKYLVVVDMQNDFIGGALGSKDAQDIVEPVANYIKDHAFNQIFVTKDTHTKFENSIEHYSVPEHCVKGTDGNEINDKVKEALNESDGVNVIEKKTFGSTELIKEVNRLGCYGGDYIQVIGLCTDICVISNVLMLRQAFPDTQIEVISDLCAGTSKEKHEAALSVMESNCVSVISLH